MNKKAMEAYIVEIILIVVVIVVVTVSLTMTLPGRVRQGVERLPITPDIECPPGTYADSASCQQACNGGGSCTKSNDCYTCSQPTR